MDVGLSRSNLLWGRYRADVPSEVGRDNLMARWGEVAVRVIGVLVSLQLVELAPRGRFERL